MDADKVSSLLNIAVTTGTLNDLSAIRAQAYDELRTINADLQKEADERKKAENERINAERAKIDTSHIEKKNPPERVDLEEERRVAEEKQAQLNPKPIPVKPDDSGQGQPVVFPQADPDDRDPARPDPASLARRV